MHQICFRPNDAPKLPIRLGRGIPMSPIPPRWRLRLLNLISLPKTNSWLRHCIYITTEMLVVDVVAGSLQIRHSLESDEGKYECIAENSVGVAYSYGANLYVRGTRWHSISVL